MMLRNIFLSLLALVVVRAGEPIPYAPAPNDAYFAEQWYLENIETNTVRRGLDINARSAWSFSRGAGITIAIVDDGVDLAHLDLTNRAAPELHWNFGNDTPSGQHPDDIFRHGTPVAGLAVAEGNNNRGVIGVAHQARFASWIIYTNRNGSLIFVPPAQLAKMFEFNIQDVQVQNHSWVKPGIQLVDMSPEEDRAISNAVVNGRAGKGVVIVRGSGNGRGDGRNANEDAYTADPRVITVSAIRPDGRVASYSTPGAPILVASLGGEQGYATLMTTDRVAQKGYNQIFFGNDLADYVFSGLGFAGTSAAAPLISGITALMLSTNPNLTARDVQHILVQAAFQPDLEDPEVQVTPAGLLVSHNTGFGMVNGATALELASTWKGVRPSVRITNTVERTTPIPDAGLKVVYSAGDQPPVTTIALPSFGVHADTNTAVLPLVYVGLATNRPTTNLTGKAALIQRGVIGMADKLENVVRAGAEFAIMINDRGTNTLDLMPGTDFISIPAVMISQAAGEELARQATNIQVEAAITLDAAEFAFQVTEPLSCEHVQVQVDATHPLRGDMRVTLVSPMGTRSVLQRLGPDVSPLNRVWTYMTTHHFYESSVGTWRLYFSDEAQGGTGLVRSASLIITGMPIKDSDADALDDDWEQTHFGSLTNSLAQDSDADGYSNAREQIQGTNPTRNENTLAVDLSRWNESFVRLNWPSRNVTYEILAAPSLDEPFEIIATVFGLFPRSAWFGEVDQRYRFFTVREAAPVP